MKISHIDMMDTAMGSPVFYDGESSESPVLSPRKVTFQDDESPLTVSDSFSERSDGYRKLVGYLNKIFVKNGKRQVKTRWAVMSSRNCKLYIYKDYNDTEPIEDIDISSATFFYDVKEEDVGQFVISVGEEKHEFEAGSVEKRSYWLQELQQERRNHSLKRSYFISHSELASVHTGTSRPLSGLLCDHRPPSELFRLSSPSKGLVPAVERPTDLDLKPDTSRSVFKKDADGVPDNSTQFKITDLLHIRQRNKSKDGIVTTSPQYSPLTSPSESGSRSLASKINETVGLSNFSQRFRRSARDRRGRDLVFGRKTSKDDCFKCEQLSSQVDSLQQDLQATEDEYHAAKEVITMLQMQVDALTLDKEALLRLQSAKCAEPSLLHLLEARAVQLVELRHQSQVLSLQQEQYERIMDDLRDRIAMYQETLEAKNEAVIRLTNEIHDIVQSNGMGRMDYTEMIANEKSTNKISSKEDLQDTVTAYRCQNDFLNKEILELNHLRQDAVTREQKLLMEASEWEARFYQIQSKYLLLLNEFHNPQASQDTSNREMLSQLLDDIVGEKSYVKLVQGQTYNQYGFRQEPPKDSLKTVAAHLQKKSDVLTNNLQEQEDTTLECRWDSLVSSIESRDIHRQGDIKQLIRMGVPSHRRGTVWKGIVESRLRGQRGTMKAGYYQKLLSSYRPSPRLTPAAKQIELDLVRTLPNNRHYESLHADGIPKLRRVLLAYSLHNSQVEYCQGFNRLVAIALLFMKEEDAFKCLVYIVEHLMPPDYYNRQLIGAQVDQHVLKDLLAEKLPNLHNHLEEHSADISIFTLNWFLCLFVDGIAVDAYLRIWDTYLFEGSKVLFRYSLAILKHFEKDILECKDCMSIFNCLRAITESSIDMKQVSLIAFQQLNPFSMRNIATKREHHRKILKAQFDELESLRLDFCEEPSQKQSFGSDDDD